MAAVPEHEDNEQPNLSVPARPVVRIDIDAPDGVELRITINGVDVDLGD